MAVKDYGYQIVLKDLSKFSKVYLVPLSDFHIGCGHTALDTIQGYLDWIKNTKEAFTILNGDLLNGATKTSSAELFEDLITPDKAYEQLRTMLMPIKNKILMITRGGHEEAIFRQVGTDYMARLAYDLGEIPYKPDGGTVGMRLGRSNGEYTMVFFAYATHGWGGARTIGAKVKKVEDLVSVADADIYILSHDHTQNVHRLNVLTPPYQNIRWNRPIYLTVKRKLLVNTGGFIRYSGYIQRKGYMPQDLGTPRIRLEIKHDGENGYHKDIHSSI